MNEGLRVNNGGPFLNILQRRKVNRASSKDRSMFVGERSCLSSLLPYDLEKKSRAALRVGLNEYLLLLSGAQNAIDAFENNELEKFDALVGENACQIRAVWIAIISLKNEICFRNILREIISVKDKVSELLSEKTIHKLMNSGISLREVFVKENLFINLNVQEAFVVQCFLLREVKSSNCDDRFSDSLLIKEKCVPKKLMKFGRTSSNFTNNLVSKLRNNTSKLSIQFIRDYANLSQDQNLIEMVSDKYTIAHNNYLLCTPMFWTYKVVLFAAKLEGVKLVLHVKLINNNNSHYEVSDECWFDSEYHTGTKKSGWCIRKIDREQVRDKPCVVFQGVASTRDLNFFSRERWESNFQKFLVDTIVLAGAADHRQYPNESDNYNFFRLVQDHECESYKALAKEEGFSIENPSTFFIQHVYATTTGALKLKRLSINASGCYQTG